MMNSREQKIIAAVDALFDDILNLTMRLIGEPSTLCNEAGAVALLEETWRALGLSPVRVPVEPEKLASHPGFAPVPWSYEGRDNLVAVREADGEGGRSALFNGHLDVVSPEPVELWQSDPFVPVARNGWIYGRGGGDMKGGVAAMTYALHAVERAGFGLRAPVTLAAVIEEECCGNGALATLAAGYDGEGVLIPEPFGPAIYTAQVGVLWFRVRLRGTAAHVQDTAAGANAVEKCWPLITALRALEVKMNAGERPAPYRSIPHPLNLNIGIMKGGDWPSTVPALAEFHGRLSFFPGTSYAAVRQRIEKAVAEAAKADPWLSAHPPEVEFYGFRSEGHILDRNRPVPATLNACHRELTGADAASYVSTCTTDLRAYRFFGRGEGTCYGPAAENIHGADERVRIDSIQQVARAYALFLARWCGLAE